MGKKWDWEKRVYDDYELFTGMVLSAPMNAIVCCADCWQFHIFWNMYTSMAIHNDIWLWYAVCASCYQKEIELRKEYPHY